MAHTLLLADDSVTIQRVIELTFADEDVKVVAVSDGDQAIARIDQAPPDIVLADIGMPGKTGYEVAQHIKQSPKLSHIPVILLTGAFEPVDQAKVAEAGCEGVLAKPFEPQLVIGRVRELLGVPTRADAAKPQPSPSPAPDAASPAHADPRSTSAPVPSKSSSIDEYFDQLDAAFANIPPAPTPPSVGAEPVSAGPGQAIAASSAADTDWFGAPPSSAPAAHEPWEFPAPPDHLQNVDIPLSYASPAEAFDRVPVRAADAGTEASQQAVTEHTIPAAAPERRTAAAADASTQPVAISPAHEPALPATVDEVTPAPAEPARATAPPPEPAVVPAPAVVAAATPPTAATNATASPAPARAVTLPPLADAFAALLAAEKEEPAPTSAPGWPASAAPVPTDELVEQVTRLVLQRLSEQTVRDTVSELVSNIAERLVREEIDRIKAALR